MSRNGAGRLFQTRGPATAKLLSPNWVLVRGTTHVRAYQLIADVDRLPPPTDSRRKGTVRRCETM